VEAIGKRFVLSGFWTLGGNWLSRGLGVIKMVVLARLLSPVDFGIMGLINLSVGVLNVFSQTGVESALIQRPVVGRKELDTAWTMTIVRGLTLFLLLTAGAGLLAAYFENDALTPVLRATAPVFLLEGFVNIGTVFFGKNLEFRRQVILESIADLCGAATAVAFALWLRNVWALVMGSLAWSAVKCLGSYVAHPYRPRIFLDGAAARDLFRFGKHIFWIGLATFVVTSGDDAIVGKVLGLSTLGFYTVAYSFANVAVTSLAGIIGRISFPAYAMIQKEPQRVKETLSKILEFTIIALLPSTALMVLLARDFCLLFLGVKWQSVVPVLQILCFLGLFRGFSNILAPVQLAVNRPEMQSRNKTIELGLFCLFVYPCTVKWGLLGAGWSVTGVYFAGAMVNALSCRALVPSFFAVLFKASWAPLLATLCLSGSVCLLGGRLGAVGPLWRMVLGAVVGLAVFAAVILTFKRRSLTNLYSEVMCK